MPLQSTRTYGALAAGLGLALVALLARAASLTPGLPLDDAWIHAAFARHLATGEGWVLFPGGTPGGETSLLWPLLLAPAEAWGGSAPALALALGSAAWFVVPGLAGSLARSPVTGRLVAVILGLCGPLLFAALSGMETIPVLAGGLGAVSLFAGGRHRAGMTLAGATTWLRPDAAVLVVVLAGAGLFLRWRQRPGPQAVREALVASLPGVILAVAGLAALAVMEGGFPPATLGGRRWISGLDPRLTFGEPTLGAARLARDWLRSVDAELGLSAATAAWPSTIAMPLRWGWRLAAAAALAAGVLVGMRARWGDSTARRGPAAPRGGAWLVLVTWAGVLLLVYGAVLPDRGHVGRYQPQVYVLLALLGVEGIVHLARRGPALVRAGAVTVALLPALGWGIGLGRAATSWVDCVSHLNGVHRRAARELSARVGPDGVVALFDVGVAAYVHTGPMIDMSGLSDPEAAFALAHRSMASLLRSRGATHVLLPVFAQDSAGSLRDRLGLMSEDGIDLERVAVYEWPQQRWARAFRYSGHAFRRLFLYRVHGFASTLAPGAMR